MEHKSNHATFLLANLHHVPLQYNLISLIGCGGFLYPVPTHLFDLTAHHCHYHSLLPPLKRFFLLFKYKPLKHYHTGHFFSYHVLGGCSLAFSFISDAFSFEGLCILSDHLARVHSNGLGLTFQSTAPKRV